MRVGAFARGLLLRGECTMELVLMCTGSYTLASFPGRSHLQYLIAYSMQIRRGKAWEISSRAVTSGRQKVDTRGAVPDEESRSPFLYYRSEGWRPER